jgi:ferredoxin
MIYYFSATGNSAWVAKEIAKETQDDAISIADLNKKGKAPIEVNAGQTLGIVFPVHGWSVPKIVREFVKRIKVDKNAFVFVVCTCGGEAGDALQILKKYIQINSAYSIIMPDNYIIMFDIESENVAREKVDQARKKLPEICKSIKTKTEEICCIKGSMPAVKSYVVAPLFYALLNDKRFHVDNNCIGCGICEQVCPLQNIKMANQRPTWNHSCMQCMACIHRCPRKAIQYGNVTQKRGRYIFKDK